MNMLALCLGAFLSGWVLPELVFVLSPRPGGFTIPALVNFILGLGFSLIAYGLKA